MSVLVIAEHDNSELKSATLNAVTAAKEISGDIDILVAGSKSGDVANVAAQVMGVSKVIHANNVCYENQLAESVAPLVSDLGKNYSHILAPATTTGKNLLPRVAALLDVAQISDIVEVKSDDTFVRPIYAGNALATVQSSDVIKVITVRTTAFADAESGGTATLETSDFAVDQSSAVFMGEKLSQSERPELTSCLLYTSPSPRD